MAVYRLQIAFNLDSEFPRDRVTITPHFFGDNPQALADAVMNNLKAHAAVGATMPMSIRVYDAVKPAPNYPLYTATNGTGFIPTTKPREVAMCLSYYSTYNRPTTRGRLYIPAVMIPGDLALRPSAAQISSVLSWKTVFRDNLPAQHNWVVFSRKMQLANGVSHVWCDDEWDTVRSRGMRSTMRTTQTLAA